MILFQQFFAQPHRRNGEAHFPVRFEGHGKLDLSLPPKAHPDVAGRRRTPADPRGLGE